MLRALQGHLPFMAAMQAVHDTLRALREGTPPGKIPGVASDDMMKGLMRDDDYRRWLREYLAG